jgi:hypothetical protein
MNGGYLSQAVRVATRIDSGFVVESMIFFLGECAQAPVSCVVSVSRAANRLLPTSPRSVSVYLSPGRKCVSHPGS